MSDRNTHQEEADDLCKNRRCRHERLLHPVTKCLVGTPTLPSSAAPCRCRKFK